MAVRKKILSEVPRGLKMKSGKGWRLASPAENARHGAIGSPKVQFVNLFVGQDHRRAKFSEDTLCAPKCNPYRLAWGLSYCIHVTSQPEHLQNPFNSLHLRRRFRNSPAKNAPKGKRAAKTLEAPQLSLEPRDEGGLLSSWA
jgi:hypothetical protein